MGKSNKRTPAVFYVGMLLLSLVVVSSYFTNGLYARYVKSYYSSAQARVASFDVNIVSDVDLYSYMIKLDEIQPGSNVPISFTVTNNSKVTVALNVTAANLTGNLPIDVPLKGTPAASLPMFSRTLNPGEVATHQFKITWNSGSTDPSAAGKTDILELKVAVEQVD
jgi:hypothetical protein